MDATAREIANQALNLAEAFLEANEDKMLALADGDRHRLYEAGEIVRMSTRRQQPGLHAAEHIAYALISEVRRRAAAVGNRTIR